MCEICALVGFDIHNDGFQVNSTISGNQTGPNIGRLADGRFVVVYQSSDTPANGIDIRARLFDANGTAIGSDFVVNQTTAGDQVAPVFFANSNGTLSAVWRTPDPALAGNAQLVERSFDLLGTPLGAEHQVSVSGADGGYTFTQRPNGTIFLVYENRGDLYGRTLDANFNPLTAEVQLNTTTAGIQTAARLVTLANGNVLVAFQSNDDGDGGGGSGNVIRNRVFATTGDAWTPISINGSTNDFVVDTTGTGDQIRETLTRLADGSVLEVWQSNDTGDGSGTTVRGRIISASGDPATAGPDFIVDTTTTGDQSRPAILGFDDGRRLVYWHSFESATDTIRGRFVHADGTLEPSDFIIAHLSDTAAPTFSLALLTNQQVLFTYQGVSSGDGAGAGIQGAIGSVGNLTLSSTFLNTGSSPFDLALPSFDWDQAAAQISRGNAPWNDVLGSPDSFTYSYRATSTGVSYTNGASGFTQFNTTEIATAEAAIQLWEDVANITLTRVQDAGSQYSDSGQFLLWNYATSTANSQAANASGFGGATFSGGTWRHFVYLNDDRSTVTAPTIDNNGFALFLHEIGHALGLSHPGNYNVLPGGASVAYDGNAVYREDTTQYTVMSYFSESITHANFVDTFPASPLLDDIAALQRLYGANTTTRAGDTIYGFNSNTGRDSYTIASSNQHAVFAVWDGGGNDTLDFSGYATRQIITLVPEQFSSVGGLEFNVAIARGTVIETAIGGSGSDTITGNDANNTLRGNGGDDTLVGGPGNDLLIGGAGTDTATYAAAANTYTLLSYNGTVAVLTHGTDGDDRLQGIENIQFSDTSVPASAAAAFDPWEYLASYSDLIGAFGANPQAGFDHYVDFGFNEGRSTHTFDAIEYIASNSDLIAAFGNNPDAGAAHYVQYGVHEGRSLNSFDAIEYIASNSDLIAAFGNNPDAGAAHYVQYGVHEGRSLNSFDAIEYIASNSDLITAFGNNPDAGAAHYVQYGVHEGRSLNSFDAIEYIASNSDLIAAFGNNPDAGAAHYVQYGVHEGRSLNSFDAIEYIASNPDLITAFGNNPDAGAAHYVQYGVHEGRSLNSFDAIEYIASNSDLITAFGNNPDAGAAHYVQYGVHEGRSLNSFNAEQYLANYQDLQAAFGDDPDVAAAHYVQYGVHEGRTDHALPGGNLGVFNGNSNNNTMVVGNGDTMTGGAGNDAFVFKTALTSAATITDFTHGSDVLDIQASGFGHGLTAGATVPVVTAADIGSASHAGTGGYFIFDNAGPNISTLYWDATGGSGVDATAIAHLTNVTSLTASDFHLV